MNGLSSVRRHGHGKRPGRTSLLVRDIPRDLGCQ